MAIHPLAHAPIQVAQRVEADREFAIHASHDRLIDRQRPHRSVPQLPKRLGIDIDLIWDCWH